uniref:Coiled-coil domain-containing protein 137 n=1 Tax=Loa loa TaxID=7209 RepID=A0A1I7V5G1_LOALO
MATVGHGLSRHSTSVLPNKSVTPNKPIAPQKQVRNSAKELQRPATGNMQYAYEELPLGNRAFALRMRCLEEKKQMEKAKREQLNKKFKQKRNKPSTRK